MGLTIGDLSVLNPVLLAPMSGITDAPFRKLVFELGAGLVVSEMIASEQLAGNDPVQLRKAHDVGGSGPLVVQLAGREAKWMARAAKMARQLGARVIDINMGCPAKQVTNGASGAALMRDMDHALRLIEATVEAVDVPVTLKMRLGWDEHSLNAAALARRAQNAGVRMISVHGRTRRQFYRGRADWEAIGEVVRAVDIPVLANGDITETGHAANALEMSRADGVMIGRGACGAPWFPGLVAAKLAGTPGLGPSFARQWQIIRRHYRDMLDHYGAELGVRCARKHLAWYIEKALGRGGADETVRSWRRKICTSEEPAAVLDHLEHFYQTLDARSAA